LVDWQSLVMSPVEYSTGPNQGHAAQLLSF
jgi:hypothetical protein